MDRGRYTEGAAGPISPSWHTRTPEAQDLRNNGVWFKHENKALDARHLYHQMSETSQYRALRFVLLDMGLRLAAVWFFPAEDSPSFK